MHPIYHLEKKRGKKKEEENKMAKQQEKYVTKSKNILQIAWA